MVALFYNARNTVSMRNVIDVRDALYLGTFDDPIEFLILIPSETNLGFVLFSCTAATAAISWSEKTYNLSYS